MNEKINTDSLKNKIGLNTNDFLIKIKNYLITDNVLKKVLKDEIQYMREQCHWQEMINFIFLIFLFCFLFVDILIIKIEEMKFEIFLINIIYIFSFLSFFY